MNEELTTFIIRELGKHHDRKKIIQRVCEQGGLNWKEAEQLVLLVEAQHKDIVVERQNPLLFLFSIGTLLMGIALLAFSLQIVATLFQKDVLWQVLTLQGGYDRLIGSAVGFGVTIGGLFIGLITGFSMTTAGAIGLWKTLSSIFPE